MTRICEKCGKAKIELLTSWACPECPTQAESPKGFTSTNYLAPPPLSSPGEGFWMMQLIKLPQRSNFVSTEEKIYKLGREVCSQSPHFSPNTLVTCPETWVSILTKLAPSSYFKPSNGECCASCRGFGFEGQLNGRCCYLLPLNVYTAYSIPNGTVYVFDSHYANLTKDSDSYFLRSQRAIAQTKI